MLFVVIFYVLTAWLYVWGSYRVWCHTVWYISTEVSEAYTASFCTVQHEDGDSMFVRKSVYL